MPKLSYGVVSSYVLRDKQKTVSIPSPSPSSPATAQLNARLPQLTSAPQTKNKKERGSGFIISDENRRRQTGVETLRAPSPFRHLGSLKRKRLS